MKEVSISFDILREYVEANKKEKQSLLNFAMQKHPGLGEDITPSLQGIVFDESHKIDLSGTDLSFCKLTSINFDSKYCILKGSNLQHCDLDGATFTGKIDLESVNFGSIIIDTRMFRDCQLRNAIYSPSKTNVALLQVDDKLLKLYIKLRSEGNEIAQGSLNDFLTIKFRDRFPEGTAIIANLEKLKINASHSGIDISGSRIMDCTISGEVKDLQMRDCKLENLIFDNCTLISPDLRGTALRTEIMVEGKVAFESPKLSMGIPLESAKIRLKGILDNDVLEPIGIKCTGEINDPCYKRGSGDAPRTYRRATKDDVLAYKDFSEKNPEVRKSFTEFMADGKEWQPVDASRLDLSNIDLHALDFSNTSFAGCKLEGVNFDGAKLVNCNFNNADFSGNLTNFFTFGLFGRKAASLNRADLTDSTMIGANLMNVKADGAKLDNIMAINVYGHKISLIGAKAENGIFSAANLYNANMTALIGEHADFKSVLARYAILKKAKLEGANLDHAAFDNADFTDASLKYANLVGTRLKQAKLVRTEFKHARMQANVSGAFMEETILEEADLAGLLFDPDDKPQIINCDLSKAIESPEKHQLATMQIEQDMKRNAAKIHFRYKVALFCGLIALGILPIAFASAGILPAGLAAALVVSSLPIITSYCSAVTAIFWAPNVISRITNGLADLIDNNLPFGFKPVSLALKVIGRVMETINFDPIINYVSDSIPIIGAKQVIDRVNTSLQRLLQEENKILADITMQQAAVKKCERDIAKTSSIDEQPSKQNHIKDRDQEKTASPFLERII